MREFLRTLTGVLIVLAVFYAGLLLFLISGPSMEDVDNLRKIAFWVLLLAIVASGMLIFLGARIFSVGSADEALEERGIPGPATDAEEVMLEEYLGLGDEEAREEEAEDAEVDEDDSEEGHA